VFDETDDGRLVLNDYRRVRTWLLDTAAVEDGEWPTLSERSTGYRKGSLPRRRRTRS
jgi:hypothetical protein